MQSASDKDNDDEEAEDLAGRVTEPPEPSTKSALAKTGGRLARWFKLRASMMSTEHLVPDSEETQGSEDESEDSSILDITAASTSKRKPKKKPQTPRGGDNPKRRQSALASGQPSAASEIQQPRDRRRLSTPATRDGRLSGSPGSNSKAGERAMPTPLQKLLILETQEQNERIKKLRDEMEGKLEEIREIETQQVNRQVEGSLAEEIVQKQKEDEEDLKAIRVTIRQELGETRLKPLKDKLKSELEERIKSKQTQSRSDTEDAQTRVRNDYANQAKVLMLEYEKKGERERKPASEEARAKARRETEEEAQSLEAFVKAQVTHETQKIDVECDLRIEAINRERKERQLAIRQRGLKTVESHRNRPEILQELDEEESASSKVDTAENERLRKQKNIALADLAQREALALAAVEREAAQKLALTITSLEEQNRSKLQECIAEIEREVETRIKSEKIVKVGEKRKPMEHRRSKLQNVAEEDHSVASSVNKKGKIQTEKSGPGAIQAKQLQVAKPRRDVGKQQLIQHQPQVSQKAESSHSSELTETDPDRPKRTLIEEELLREAQQFINNPDSMSSASLKKIIKSLDSSDALALKKHLKSLSAKTGKVVLFEALGTFKKPRTPHACTCVKDGKFSCAPFVETAVQIIREATERPRGRSFAHPHSRESVYSRWSTERSMLREKKTPE